MNGKIALRVVSGFVLLAVIAAIGFFAFQAGVAKGSPITIEAPSGDAVPAPYPYYGYGYGMRFPHPFTGGLGCLIPLFAVFLLVLALKSFRVMMWGPRWGWGGHRMWHPRGEGGDGVPPMFDEWHKRSHEDWHKEKRHPRAEAPEEKKE